MADDNVYRLPPTPLEVAAKLELLGMSQNQAAARIGISQSALSQWMHGKYGGDIPTVEAKIARWLDTQAEIELHSLSAAGLDQYRALGYAGEAHALFAHAQAASDIVLIHGPSGLGKSWASERYCAERSGAHLVVMSSATGTMPGMLAKVAAAVGAYTDQPSAMRYEAAIMEKLRDRGAVLVVDEAHQLTARLLDELRCIRDQAGIGLALVGNESILMTLARCPQILGRVGGRLNREAVYDADVETLVAGFLGRAPLAAEMKAALAAARSEKGLHALRRLLALAWMSARTEGRDVVWAEDLQLALTGIALEADAPRNRRASA